MEVVLSKEAEIKDIYWLTFNSTSSNGSGLESNSFSFLSRSRRSSIKKQHAWFSSNYFIINKKSSACVWFDEDDDDDDIDSRRTISRTKSLTSGRKT